MLRGWCLGVVVWVGVWGEARRGSRGGRRGGAGCSGNRQSQGTGWELALCDSCKEKVPRDGCLLLLAAHRTSNCS